ncbi:MAG TPA: nicotinate phosphoribosyltransferase [Solirubrobacterales bacterium]
MSDANDPGLLTAAQASLLVDQYELTMSASYLRRGLDRPAIFELFARKLPPHRHWALAAGLGPTLRIVRELRFGAEELDYLAGLGFADDFLEYLRGFRFSGHIDAVPEGTVVFANEPLLRVTASRVEAQLLETILLNQINFQTMIATKAARVVLAAGGGSVGAGDRVLDFSPRRDHGIDAAMKVARSCAVAGVRATSNVAAAMRFGLRPVGTMAHSYVMSFPSELEAFKAFLVDQPQNAVLLVDTYDTRQGVLNAIKASQETGVKLLGIRIDSGDLLALSREARELLDAAGMADTRIAASGDLEEHRIAQLVAAGAPIDLWGVGTELGTSRDAPVFNGVYKLVANWDEERGEWRGVAKHSVDKATVGGAKQIFREREDGVMARDVIGRPDEELPGERLIVPVMRDGEIVHSESLDEISARAEEQLSALPEPLRTGGDDTEPYPVSFSERLRAANDAARG